MPSAPGANTLPRSYLQLGNGGNSEKSIAKDLIKTFYNGF